jgi:chemotaxis response regulator CheB
MTQERPTALFADDEPLLRRSLVRLLEDAWPALDIVEQARNGREAVEMFEALQPDFPAMRARTNARIEEARRSLWRINLFAVVVLLIAIAMIASKFLGR